MYFEDNENPDRFVNFYLCPRCGREWRDIWSCMCDDDCPHCGCRHISPFQSLDVEAPPDETLVTHFDPDYKDKGTRCG